MDGKCLHFRASLRRRAQHWPCWSPRIVGFLEASLVNTGNSTSKRVSKKTVKLSYFRLTVSSSTNPWTLPRLSSVAPSSAPLSEERCSLCIQTPLMLKTVVLVKWKTINLAKFMVLVLIKTVRMSWPERWLSRGTMKSTVSLARNLRYSRSFIAISLIDIACGF